MTISARYNLLLCLNLFYIVSHFVFSVIQVATTLVNAQVCKSWETALNYLKCFFWIVDSFILCGLFDCI